MQPRQQQIVLQHYYFIVSQMHTGPTLQQNLFSIITRWRKHVVAFQYQRILWRKSSNKPVLDYQLWTVTYGTSAAPFLAIKTLQTLAEDERTRFPVATQIALRDMYVDDVCSGADDIKYALIAQSQLIEMFRAGGFTLRKWTSNSYELLESVELFL